MVEVNVESLFVQLRHLAVVDLSVSQLLTILPQVIRVVEKNVHKPGSEKRRCALELVALLLSEAKVDEGLIGDALQVAEVGINTLCGVRSGEIDLGKAATGCCHVLSKRIK